MNVPVAAQRRSMYGIHLVVIEAKTGTINKASRFIKLFVPKAPDVISEPLTHHHIGVFSSNKGKG